MADPKHKHAPHVAWRRIDQEAVILDLNTSVYYTLNETAAAAWELLGSGTSRQEVIDALTEEFETSRPQASSDVDELLLYLKRENLLVEA